MSRVHKNWLVGVRREGEDGSYTFKIFSNPISDQAFEEFERIVQVMADLRPTIVDFVACVLALDRIVEIQKNVFQDLSEMNSHFRLGEAAIERHSQVQCSIESFLCSTSGFRERLVWRVEKLGGDKDELKSFLSLLYDNNFEYGLFYYLRNFSQHFNSIINRIPVQAKGLATADPKIEVSLEIDRDELIARSSELEDGHNIRRKLVPMLQQAPASMPLIDLCRAYLNQLKSVLLYAFKLKDAELHEYVSYVQAAKKAVGEGYEPAIFHGDIEDFSGAVAGEEANFQSTLFSTDEFEYLISLLRQEY